MKKSQERIVTLLILSGISLLFPQCRKYSYDSFRPYELRVSSPKAIYNVGDTIELTFEVISAQPGYIRLFKDRAKSMRLFLRGVIGGEPDFEDIEFYQPYIPPSKKDEIEVIELDQDNPFRMQVEGKIINNNKGKGIIFDFGKFGMFAKKGPGRYMVGGYWIPIRPAPTDSLENCTNKIIIEVQNK